MAKTKRPFLRLLFLTLLLFGLPVVIAPFVPLDPLKPAVETRISHLLGRQVTVGSLRLSLLGGPYLYINQMTAKEDPTFGEGDFLHADQVRADFSMIGYVLRRRVEIDGLRVQSPDLRFTKNSEGVWSWTTLGKSEKAAQSTTGAKRNTQLSMLFTALFQNIGDATIQKIWIEDASVRLTDGAAAQPSETLYRQVNLQATIDRQSGNSQVTGRWSANSEGQDGAERLRADMPFALTIDRSASPNFVAAGSIGPGAIESNNFAAENFTSTVQVTDGTLALKQMTMNLYEGSLRGDLRLDFATQQFTAEGEVENLNLDESLGSKVQVPGQITGHINARFKLSGLMAAFQKTVPTIVGDGRVTSNGLYIASVNLSERVAQALKLNQIGDMEQGTRLGGLEADFHIEQGIVSTRNLQIQQLDGLGDATSDQGWFRVEAAPTFNYAASVLLSSDATAQVKNTSPIIGAAVTVFEYNNRVAVPVNITGEVRNPQVAVDVKKFIFGF